MKNHHHHHHHHHHPINLIYSHMNGMMMIVDAVFQHFICPFPLLKYQSMNPFEIYDYPYEIPEIYDYPHEIHGISLGLPCHFIVQGPSGAAGNAQLEQRRRRRRILPGHGGLQLAHAAALA